MRLSPDDPKLTAYALGELSGDERAAIEAALRKNPALRAVVEEIRATAAQLEAALADESAAATATPFEVELPRREPGKVVPFAGVNGPVASSPPSKRRRVAVESHDETEKTPALPYPIPQVQHNPLRTPQVYYFVGGLAAACFALLVALRQPPTVTVIVQPPAVAAVEAKTYREIPLAPASAAPGVENPDTTDDHDFVSSARRGEALVAAPTPAPADGTAPAAAPVANAFLEGDLSLLAQAKHERERAIDPESLVAGVLAGGKKENETVPTSNAPVSTTDAATAPVPVEMPAPRERFTFTAVPPTVAESVSAHGSLGALVLGANTLTLASSVTATPGVGETVVLSAMRVSAHRAVGFATESSNGSVGANRMGVFDRGYLPRPPAGAKFARGRESTTYARDNEFVRAGPSPLSTFSIDVDTASYANVRRIIELGSPPPRDAVRIEELLNYFPFQYAAPQGEVPLAATLEVAQAPWAPSHRLVRIGLKAREVSETQRAAASLVFLLDVSSSMNQPNKLPLVKQSMRRLIGRLRPDDRVAIVTYSGNAGLVLPSTPVERAREILHALDALTPGESNGGLSGIQLAYDLARQNFRKDGLNRVILCTDGDFELGLANEADLVRFVEQKADTGIALTVLGFGLGSYRDATLEKLAVTGNGTHGYIDTPREAEKLLVEQVSSTLVTVAKDVRLQVEFNPAKVSSYRLIGYENRLLRKEDFNLDTFDAGEIGAGHTLTALYEIVPVGAEDKTTDEDAPLDDLRYAAQTSVSARFETLGGTHDPVSRELLTVKVRFKKPGSFLPWPRTLNFPLLDAATSFTKASADFRFAAAVAQFGMILRGSPHRGAATMADVTAWASSAITPQNDAGGYRTEFLELLRKAQGMLE